MELAPSEKEVRLLFRWSLLAKGAFALFEVLGGVLAYFVSPHFVLRFAASITEDELAGDPNDRIAHFILDTAHSFSTSGQDFIALYLIVHGVIKLFIIVGLLKHQRWAYPASFIVFTLFIAYQLYRFTTTLSPWLIIISIFDAFVLALAWHEYRSMKRAETPRVIDSQG